MTPSRDDTTRLLRSLNTASGDQGIPDQLLERSFEREWQEFSHHVAEIEAALSSTKPTKPERGNQELLEEVLTRVRSLERQFTQGGVRALRDEPAVYRFIRST